MTTPILLAVLYVLARSIVGITDVEVVDATQLELAVE
jgi:hypothetical protein